MVRAEGRQWAVPDTCEVTVHVRHRWSRRVAGVLLVTAGILGSGVVPAGATPTPAAAVALRPSVVVDGIDLNSFESSLLNKLNRARASAGAPRLRLAGGVTDVARQWAATLARGGPLVARPDLGAALDATGSAGWTRAVEDEASATTAVKLYSAFMSAPEHRANLLDPRVSAVGLGAVAAPDGRWRTVLVLVDKADNRAATTRPSR